MHVSIGNALGIVADTMLHKIFSKASFLDNSLGRIIGQKPTEWLSKSIIERTSKAVGEVLTSSLPGEGSKYEKLVGETRGLMQNLIDSMDLDISLDEAMTNPSKVTSAVLRVVHKAGAWDAVKDLGMFALGKLVPKYLGGDAQSKTTRLTMCMAEKAMSWFFGGLQTHLAKETAGVSYKYDLENILARVLKDNMPQVKDGKLSYIGLLHNISGMMTAVKKEMAERNAMRERPLDAVVEELGLTEEDRVDVVLKDFESTPLTEDSSKEDVLKQNLMQQVHVDPSSGQTVKSSEQLLEEISVLPISKEKKDELTEVVKETAPERITPLPRSSVFVSKDEQGTTHGVASSVEQVSTVDMAPQRPQPVEEPRGTPQPGEVRPGEVPTETQPLEGPQPGVQTGVQPGVQPVPGPVPSPGEVAPGSSIPRIEGRDDLPVFAKDHISFVQTQGTQDVHGYVAAKGFEQTVSHIDLKFSKEPYTLYSMATSALSALTSMTYTVSGWFCGSSDPVSSTQPPPPPPPPPSTQTQESRDTSWWGWAKSSVVSAVSTGASYVGKLALSTLAGSDSSGETVSDAAHAALNVGKKISAMQQSDMCNKLLQSCGGNMETFTRVTAFMTPEAVDQLLVKPSQALIDPETKIMTINGEQYKLASLKPHVKYHVFNNDSGEKPFVHLTMTVEWDVVEYKKVDEESWHKPTPDTPCSISTYAGVVVYHNPEHGQVNLMNPVTTASIHSHVQVKE